MKEYKAFSNAAIDVTREVNPVNTISFSAHATALSGLANQEPGTSVVSLANFSSAVQGFDPADGTMIYRDPSRELNNEGDLPAINATVVHLPFCG